MDPYNALALKALETIAMKRSLLKISLALALFATHALVLADVKLITEEEAKTPNLQVPATRAITRGPGISMQTPLEVSAKSFAFKLAFEPRGGAKIDHNSIKFEYLKQPIVDLTTRFKLGISGNTIELAQASVPVGSHQIRVFVRDSEGREAQTTLHLNAK